MTTARADASDPSTRFILPEDAPYLRNMAALWAAEPGLAARIEALDPDAGYPVQPSKSGPPTIALPAGGAGRSVFLHSRYEPVEEARRLVAEVDAEKHAACYVHGFGLGYHVDALFERLSD
jgi:hypothetical protein